MSDPRPHEHCAQCGFDGATYDNDALLAALESLEPRWRELLSGAGKDLRRRPAPEVWSAIEYAAHSRDITALHQFGVKEALLMAEADYGNLQGDELIEAAAATYAELDPDVVLDALGRGAAMMVSAAKTAGETMWGFGVTVNGTRMDVRALMEHALHDSVHHLDDVQRGLAQLHAS